MQCKGNESTSPHSLFTSSAFSGKTEHVKLKKGHIATGFKVLPNVCKASLKTQVPFAALQAHSKEESPTP